MKMFKPTILKSFLVNFLLVLTLLAIPVSGVAKGESFKLSMPTEFIPAMDKNGAPRYITAEQIEKTLQGTARDSKSYIGIRQLNSSYSPVINGCKSS